MTRKRYDKQFKVAAAKVIQAGEMSVKQLSRELEIKDTTLRRWANEYEKLGEAAFPGNGSPTQNKDFEILKLKKHIDELEMENKLLKNFRAFLNQDRA
jgi:transposase